MDKFTKKDLMKILEDVPDDAIIKVNCFDSALIVWDGTAQILDENSNTPDCVMLYAGN